MKRDGSSRSYESTNVGKGKMSKDGERIEEAFSHFLDVRRAVGGPRFWGKLYGL